MFSKKIGVSDGLGLQECMATINDGLDDELQVHKMFYKQTLWDHIMSFSGVGVQEQRIPSRAHIIGSSLHRDPSTGTRPLLVSPLVGDGLQATVHP